MPRIPVRTTPYHTLPRCTRHYKSKRDLILRALGKASFINGSQFVIAWISPKGEVDVYASELLQGAVSAKEGGVLNRKELEREAGRVKGEMGRRWEEIRRLEEKGEAPVMEDEDEDGDEDGDKTLVDDDSTGMSVVDIELKKPSSLVIAPVTAAPTPVPSSNLSTATRQSTPSPPMHTLTLAPDAIEAYYTSRFAALQQATCKLVVKAWIKVIEPKKQMKYPYNKGEELKPAWWPEGVRHREPDHLSKTERLTLLASIVRSPLITVSRLELSTAEAAAFISRPRLAILREVYLVAKEEEKKRTGVTEDANLVVHLPNLPVSPSAVSPEGPDNLPLKRSYAENKENASAYPAHSAKRNKSAHPHGPARLAPLMTQTNYYDHQAAHPHHPTAPFTYAAQWRDPNQAHLSPYPSEMGYSGSDYGRSPNPEQIAAQSTEVRPYPHPTHLAPLLNHSHSPADSPGFPQTATLAPPPPATSAPSSGYYGRTATGQSYMQQQQMEYLQAHGHYDYGSPYLADNAWDGQFAPPTELRV
ncbi:hypothetical protein DB88DRAFT_534896 [Papiliotrema laurentii]|uniref:Subtelomeric hrmA-associated cluster protein AFUB-079030/YDR124W-like helical bundle domain-containing protein n=1 Tax=Papiliotrema laurentii TaxID=5418 RepID=A0AAD9FRR8_PAPLA|nr:hypothetical protein DB88DRAFT_534896 [Papiliotrema laurentii]